MKNNKLKSYSLKLSEKNCPALDFFSILKTTILQKMWSNRPRHKKVVDRFLTEKDFIINLFIVNAKKFGYIRIDQIV